MTSRDFALTYVINTLEPGGTERLALSMALHFNQYYKVTVICLDGAGGWAGQLRDAGIDVLPMWRQPGLDLAVSQRIAKELRKSETSIVHAHQYSAWFYSAIAKYMYRQPRLIFEEHGRFYPEIDKPLRRLVNQLVLAPVTYRSVAVSEDIKKRLQRYEGLSSNKIDVIYNGCDAAPELNNQKRLDLRASFGISDDDFLVGSVGRLDDIKNYRMLVDAVLAVAKKKPRVFGAIVGDGPERSALSQQIEQAENGDHFSLWGYSDCASSLVQCFDLFVLPSFSEGTSMALLEAMSGGVPCIVTDVGGNTELVSKDKSAWVIDSNDLCGLIASIIEAEGNAGLRASYVLQANQAFQRFSTSAMMDAYQSLYESSNRV